MSQMEMMRMHTYIHTHIYTRICSGKIVQEDYRSTKHYSKPIELEIIAKLEL